MPIQMPPLTRATPRLPVGAMKSYAITRPSDRTVIAACHEVGCEFWRDGWDSIVDESTADGQIQAAAIRRKSSRTFRELRAADGRTVFRFEPGQRCFREHRTKRQIFVVRDGDWRGNPTRQRRQHANAADWLEDFALHQQGIAGAVQRG